MPKKKKKQESAITAIVCADKNYGIGYNNELLIHIPEDLKHFSRMTSGGIVVMGNEGKGVSAECAAHFTDRLLIPSYPPARQGSESLNVAMATGIVCAEFRRRLRD